MIRAMLRELGVVDVYQERGKKSVRMNPGSVLKQHVLAKDERNRVSGKKPLTEEDHIRSLLPNALSLFVRDEEG